MTSDDGLLRLAELIVSALEVETGKQEDIIGEICTRFDVNLGLVEQWPRGQPNRTFLVRQHLAGLLAAAAPSTADLLNEFIRCGGRFIAMLDEVFARLHKHASTVDSAAGADVFRLTRGLVDEDSLTISPAFVEQIRRLRRSVQAIDIGQIDEAGLSNFILSDGGEFYGTWPPRTYVGLEARLADAVLHLAWLMPTLDSRSGQPDWLAVTGAATRAAADRLVAASERIVAAHFAHLDAIGNGDPAHLETAVLSNSLDDLGHRRLAAEVRQFRTRGFVGAIVMPQWVPLIGNQPATVGLNRDLRPVVIDDAITTDATGVGQLAAFVAMYRMGMWAVRRQPELEEALMADLDRLRRWLEYLIEAAEEATQWLNDKVLTPTSNVDIFALWESIEEFLNLPLWRARQLLYEAWLLCATLDAAEAADWMVSLAGLQPEGGIWTLSLERSPDPVARLARRGAPEPELAVWREPIRSTSEGDVTPDIVVSSLGNPSRDLLVVEAKDKVGMASGVPSRPNLDRNDEDRPAVPALPGRRSAIGVGLRYAQALHPVATWVCNHCDFSRAVGPSSSHGDAWSQVHVAGPFRPGNLPPSFTASVRQALRAPSDEVPAAGDPAQALVVVADLTGSMRDSIRDICEEFGEAPPWTTFTTFRAVVYSDHGDDEPFLVRKIGPFTDRAELLAAIAEHQPGGGHGGAAALEDALQRCTELVDDIGPQTIVVLTDAPGNTPERCPYRIDLMATTSALLKAGCRFEIASFRKLNLDPAWLPFLTHPRFEWESVRTIAASLANDPIRVG